jgi:uncharacterized protein
MPTENTISQKLVPWDSEKDFWILSLSGGGYRGLFSAVILEELERLAGEPLANKFDLIAGTSVGSILASAVAKEIPTEDLPPLFTEHGKEIFDRRKLFGALWGGLASRYRANALRELLEHEDRLSSTTFNDLKHRLIIPTVNLSKGGPQYFKTQHHPRFSQDGRRQVVEAVLASSAAPTYFPVHKFEDNRYADGGLIANSPLLAAIHEAVYLLKVPPENVHAISIGTMGSRLTIDPKMRLGAGLLQWNKKLVEMPMAAQEDMQDYMAGHVIEDRLIKLDRIQTKQQSNRLGLDSVDQHAQEVLRGNARTVIQEDLHNSLIEKWKQHNAVEPVFYN